MKTIVFGLIAVFYSWTENKHKGERMHTFATIAIGLLLIGLGVYGIIVHTQWFPYPIDVNEY